MGDVRFQLLAGVPRLMLGLLLDESVDRHHRRLAWVCRHLQVADNLAQRVVLGAQLRELGARVTRAAIVGEQVDELVPEGVGAHVPANANCLGSVPVREHPSPHALEPLHRLCAELALGLRHMFTPFFDNPLKIRASSLPAVRAKPRV